MKKGDSGLSHIIILFHVVIVMYKVITVNLRMIDKYPVTKCIKSIEAAHGTNK